MISPISKTNTYYTSNGNAITASVLEWKIINAKRLKLLQLKNKYGFFFCEDCKRNENCGEPLDLSHDVSVKWAKENRQSELCYDINNIKLRCRTCHRKHDKS